MSHRAKVIPILLAMFIASAQLLCSCRAVMAAAMAPASPSPHSSHTAHSCCEKSPAGPTLPVRDCPHCDGTAAASLAPPASDAGAIAAFDFVLLPAAVPPLLAPATCGAPSSRRTILPTDLPASTLFGLHCAQLC